MTKRKTASIKRSSKRGNEVRVVYLSNDLVEAKYMFNVWETRFFLSLATLIKHDDSEDREYKVWLKDVIDTFDLRNSHNAYELLRDAARSLQIKPVYIGWKNDDFRRGREYVLFEFIDYLEDGQSGKDIASQEYIGVKITERMKPFLLHVKNNYDPLLTRYTSFDARNTRRLKPYAVRIYGLLKQFEYKGFRTITIEDLKEMFMIKDEYPRFSTFNQSVIIPSIKAINKNTDITVPLDRIQKLKKGRKVYALRFVIQSKSKTDVEKLRWEQQEQPTLFDGIAQTVEIVEAEVIEPQELDQTQVDILYNQFEEIVVKSFGVTPSAFIKLLTGEKYDAPKIEQAINVTRRAKNNGEIFKSAAGFFLKALKEGYTDAQEEGKKKKKEKAQMIQKLTEKLEAVKAERNLKINEKIKELTANDPMITDQAIALVKEKFLSKKRIAKKEQELGRSLTVEDFREDGTLRTFVINEIKEMYQEEFDRVGGEDLVKIRRLEKRLLI